MNKYSTSVSLLLLKYYRCSFSIIFGSIASLVQLPQNGLRTQLPSPEAVLTNTVVSTCRADSSWQADFTGNGICTATILKKQLKLWNSSKTLSTHFSCQRKHVQYQLFNYYAKLSDKYHVTSSQWTVTDYCKS